MRIARFPQHVLHLSEGKEKLFLYASRHFFLRQKKRGEELRDCLKKWEPEFAALIKKKRRVALLEDTTVVSLVMQVDPGMI